MADGPLAFSCECGTVRGEVSPGQDLAIRCHCSDCRSAYTIHDRPDPGPVEILQVTQGRMRFTSGADHVAALRLGPKGGLRIYAACCRSPLAYIGPKPRIAFAALNADRLDDPSAFGPVEAEAFVPKRGGGQTHKGLLRMMSGLASRILSENLSGDWRNSPFFDKGGDPVHAARQISRAERAEARRRLRP